MNNVPCLERQKELKQWFEDDFVSLLTYAYVNGHIKLSEMEWMFEWVSNGFRLPSLAQHLDHKEVPVAYESSIVQRNEGKTIPDEFLNIAVKTNDQYIGYAILEDNELSIGQTKELEDVKESLLKPDYFVISFAKGANTEESKQPFNTLQNEGGNCICASFIEGDCQGFGSPESSHSIQWAVHQEYLMPKIIDIFTDCEENVANTVEKLNRAITKHEIANNCFPGVSARGEILIIFGNKQIINIVKGNKHKEYEWGVVSQSFAYEEKKTSEPIKTGLGSKGAIVPKPPTTAIAAAMTKAVDKVDASKTNLSHLIIPPIHRLSSFKDAKSFYKTYCDPIPSDIELELTVKNKIPIAGRIKPIISSVIFDTLINQKKIFLAPEGSLLPAATNIEPDIPIVIIPQIEREKMFKSIQPKILRALDDKSTWIVPPDKLVTFLSKIPSATEQLGLKMGLDEFENYWEIWDLMIKECPRIIRSILDQYRNERFMLKTTFASKQENKKAM